MNSIRGLAEVVVCSRVSKLAVAEVVHAAVAICRCSGGTGA